MHKLRTLTAGLAAAAAIAVAASAAVPALADPPTSGGKQIVPKVYDIVSVGSNTDENLFNALSASYDATIPAKKHSASHPYLYTWNATKPGSTSTAKTSIVPKAGCKSITRPNGSGAGLTALEESQVVKVGKASYACVDFARSSSGRSATSPAPKPGGVGYVALDTDAVTYATRDKGATKTVPDTYAPKSLTLAQLKAIFLCTDTNWDQVGGADQPIKAYLPQPGSGTLSFWLKALGITAPGSCVSEAPEENQGESSFFNSPNAIFIYSVADWIAQKYRSPLPGHKPTKTQNQFGTDEVGYLGLDKIDGVSPITSAKIPSINAAFKSTGFTRTIYDIVRYVAAGDHIPAVENPILSRTGYFCKNAKAKTLIEDYGFLPAATCGSIS
jgi:ABC-type phosphate transport system substrate-binding protein